MLKFFRKIRQNLIDQGDAKRYLLYAIGEILLVMIGILLALQVNNWNENRKAQIQEMETLRDIKKNLESDIVNLDSIISMYRERLSYFKKVDPTFLLPKEDIVPIADTSTQLNYGWLMSRIQSFRSNQGDYLKMRGQISNKALYTNIQNLYNGMIGGGMSIYETIKAREDNLNWHRAYEKKHQPYQKISDLKDPQFLAELDYFFGAMRLYCFYLNSTKNRMQALIKEVEAELGPQ